VTVKKSDLKTRGLEESVAAKLAEQGEVSLGIDGGFKITASKTIGTEEDCQVTVNLFRYANSFTIELLSK